MQEADKSLWKCYDIRHAICIHSHLHLNKKCVHFPTWILVFMLKLYFFLKQVSILHPLTMITWCLKSMIFVVFFLLLHLGYDVLIWNYKKWFNSSVTTSLSSYFIFMLGSYCHYLNQWNAICFCRYLLII